MLPESPIRHVVLLMLENHSFDQMLGCLKSINPDLDGVDPDHPRFNKDRNGRLFYQKETDEFQTRHDPNHELDHVAVQLKDGNSGFVLDFSQVYPWSKASERQEIMGYYGLGKLPALHALGRHFPVCDLWFSSLPGPTWPNRFFALSGTSSGQVLMPEGPLHPRLDEVFVQDQTTLFDRLNQGRKSWRIYYYDFPSSLLLNQLRRSEN